MRRTVLAAVSVLAATAGLAACTSQQSFEDAAQEFIENDEEDVAQQLGVTFDDASCDAPADREVGTTFACTATGSDGATYNFIATITSRTEYSVGPGDPLTSGGGPGSSAPPSSAAPSSTPASVPTTAPASAPPSSG